MARPGKVGTAVRRSVRRAREAGIARELPPMFEALAGIAEKLADTADSSAARQDPRLLLAAMRDLRAVLAQLEPGGSVGEPAGGDGAEPDAGSAGGGDASVARVVQLMGAGPTVRDAADS